MFVKTPWRIFAIALPLLSVITAIAIVARSEEKAYDEPSFLAGREKAVWVASRSATILKSAAGARLRHAEFGEGLEIVGENGDLLKVRDASGQTGWIKKSQTSSLWILVQKAERRLTLLDMRQAKKNWRIDLGFAPVGDKIKSGDGKTPEGELYVCRKVPSSNYYKAYLLSYPSVHHADHGLDEGLITQAQHRAIVNAINSRRVPPQNTNLGNLIEIHGHGTLGIYDWTLGCVAVPNGAMDFLWELVALGTPVLIVP